MKAETGGWRLDENERQQVDLCSTRVFFILCSFTLWGPPGAPKTDIPQNLPEVARVRLGAGSARNLARKLFLLTFPALKIQGAQTNL